MMKKLVVCFLAMISMCQFATAADEGDNLVIKTKGGQSVTYYLSARPTVTFSGSNLVLKTSDVEVNYPIADIVEITFDLSTEIQKIKSDSQISFTINGNEIVANGLNKGEKMQLYTVDGKQVASTTTNADGAASVDISSLGRGAYVVKAGKKSYKILK